MSPIKVNGKAVGSNAWTPVIFNPKSAAPDAADSTPRLDWVAPATTRREIGPEGIPSPISMKLKLDASGSIESAEPLEEVEDWLLEATRAALDQWRITPARRAGENVPSEITVPVFCIGLRAGDTTERVPPKVLSSASPIYPMAMRRFGLGGSVMMEFDIDVDGSVKNLVVVRSDNPAFDEPALAAIRNSKFSPGTENGVPKRMHIQRGAEFRIEGDPDHGAFKFTVPKDQSNLPESLRYDVPPTIQNVLIPVYPYAMRRDDTRGKATAVCMIASSGRISEIEIVESSAPEFGLALAAALQGFVFEPARKEGKPVPFVFHFSQEFNYRELPDEEADRLIGIERDHPERIVGLGDLDTRLKPIARRAPLFPLGVAADVDHGTAIIECLIDEDGRVRVPRVAKATAPAFGYAAVQAVSAWWFEPPIANGHKAIVRVSIPFEFKLRER